ncbi:MAG: amino acid adenylation domain-containing protein [bacterium]|nr:amino acid adenylation domain-containing protein [bacterium]
MRSKGNIQDVYPLTPMQEGMLFYSVYDPSSPAYFEQASYRLQGVPDIPTVEKSLNELFKRHAILRTAFVYEGRDRPLQVVLKERKVDFLYEDIRDNGSADEKENHIREFKVKDRKRSFNPAKDVLMRVAVIQTEDSECEFTWSHHHILMDGWCNGIIISEYFEIYNAFMENRPPRLPEVKPYSSYIQWLEQRDKKKSEAYWAQYLEDYEDASPLPRSRRRAEGGETGSPYRREEVTSVLEKEQTLLLNQLAARRQVTLNTVVQTLWAILLGKYNRRDDVVFGSVVSGRPSEIPGVESILGLFINTVPVRIRYQAGTSFKQLLEQVQREALDGEPHHYFPLMKIQALSSLKGQLIDHLLVFENFPLEQQLDGVGGAGAVSAVESRSKDKAKMKPPQTGRKLKNVEIFEQTNFDFNLEIAPTAELRLKFEYNGNVYDRGFIERVSLHLEQAIRRVLENEAVTAAEIDLLTPREKKQLLETFNNTAAEYPAAKPVSQLFEEQVARTPENLAAAYAAKGETRAASLDYQTLNQRANQLAAKIREAGIKPEQPVALILERSLEMGTAIAAVMKAGGAFLPIDPDAPAERSRFMLEENQPPVVLVQKRLINRKRELWEGFSTTPTVIAVDDEHLYNEKNRGGNPGNVNQPQHTAFILYTSGTTGRPKGILLEHRNINNYIDGLNRRVYTRYDKVLNVALVAPYTFDGFGQMVFASLWYGHSFYIVPNEARTDGAALLDYFKTHKIDIADGSPAHIRLMLESSKGKTLDMPLKNLIIAGEILPKKSVEEFIYRFKDHTPEITNAYGPTETCGDSAMHIVNKENLQQYDPLPVGRPMPNEKIYILDRYDQLQPIGVYGEICISGDSVGRGYLNRDDLTVEAFVPDPFVSSAGVNGGNGRMYRTGDLGRWMPDAPQAEGTYSIDFLGRSDHQVKVRGFRIEPEEIKVRLLEHEEIDDAVVMAFEGTEDNFLCAYITAGKSMDVGDLRRYLSKKLPEYMIPAYFVQLEKIPLTPRGKVDKKALPEPKKSMAGKQEYAPPTNETEKAVIGIWAEVLGLDAAKIGIHDDFFQLGGNSLNILKVPSMLKKNFDLDIPMGSLFLYPTVEELALNVHEQGILNKLECVVKLTRGHREKNVFIFHPMHGMVFQYKDLAHLLGEDYNVYGIQARSMVKRTELPKNIHVMILDYIKQIREIQEKGPYLIIGYCFGDMVGYGLAQQLEAMGETVEKFIMLDEPAFIDERVLKHYRKQDIFDRILKPVKKLSAAVGKPKDDPLEAEYMAYIGKITQMEKDHAASGADVEMSTEEAEDRRNVVAITLANMSKLYYDKSAFRMIKGIVHAPIWNIRAEESDAHRFSIKNMKLMTKGNFKLLSCPGSHDTILESPNVEILADTINAILQG